MHNLLDVLTTAKGIKTPFSFRTFPTARLADRLSCFKPLTITLPSHIERPNVPNLTNFSFGRLQSVGLDMEGAFMRSNIRDTTSCHRIDRVYGDYGGNAFYATHRAFTTVLVTTGTGDNSNYYNLSSRFVDEDEDDWDETEHNLNRAKLLFGENLNPAQVVQGTPVFVFNMILGFSEYSNSQVPTVLILRPYGDVVTHTNQTFFWMFVANLQNQGVKVALLYSEADWAGQIFSQCPGYGSTRVRFTSVVGTAYQFNEVNATPRFYPDGVMDIHTYGEDKAYVTCNAVVVPNLLPSTRNPMHIPAMGSSKNLTSKPLTMFSRSALVVGRTDRVYLAHSKYLRRHNEYIANIGKGLVLATANQIANIKMDVCGMSYVDLVIPGMYFDRALERHADPRISILVPKSGVDNYKMGIEASKLVSHTRYETWDQFTEDCIKVWIKICNLNSIYPNLTDSKPVEKPKAPVVDSMPFTKKKEKKYTVTEEVMQGEPLWQGFTQEMLAEAYVANNGVIRPRLRPQYQPNPNWNAGNVEEAPVLEDAELLRAFGALEDVVL